MNATTRRTLLDLGIGIDAAIVAAGIAAFAEGEPLFQTACLLAAVTIAACARGAASGVVAAMAGVIVMCFYDADDRHLLVFAIASAALCATIALIRGHRGVRAQEIDDAPLLPTTRAIAFLSMLALPLLALVIYTNFSDIAMRNLPVPSLLQPLIFLLAAAVWHYRRELRAGAIVRQPLALALAAYTFIQFCSSIWAVDVRLADDRFVDALKSLAIFLITASLATSWNALLRVITALTIAAGALSLLSSVQTLANLSNEFLGFSRIQIAHIYGGVYEVRPAGPVGDPNFYAQFLLMIVPLALFGAWAETRTRPRILLFAGAAIIATGTLLTYSRGAMLAIGCMTIVAMLLFKPRGKHLAAVAAVGLVGLLLLPAEVTRRLLTIEALMPGTSMEVDSSIVKRKLLFHTALQMFDDHLVGGVGAGNFTRYFTRYSNEVGSAAPQYDPPGVRQYPHTLYLEIGAETGLLGLLTFGAAIASAYAALLRGRRTLLARGDVACAGIVAALLLALTGYLITSIFLHGAFQRYLFLLLALIAAATRLAEPPIHNAVEQAPLPFQPAEARS
ncbi:MAG TPA: O-antigen ligase family protein [Thermoanaerobaculia bacterium]|nr:O-antigen ligase family protein [Thermoanaerobaculia bacterium]